MSDSQRRAFRAALDEAPIVAILRGVTPDDAAEVCLALVRGGIRLIEITLNSPQPLESIRRVAPVLQEHGALLGAGTVLAAEEVEQVATAGGRYVVSPNFAPPVVQRTRELGLVSCPGVFTPSECFAAVAAGADYLKLFPARNLGLDYFRDLRAVLSAPLLAVGGVNHENIAAYLRVAAGVGIGSGLYARDKSPAEMEAAARALVQAARG